MQPDMNNSANIPAFLIKVWKIVGDPTTDHLISWNHAGSSFIVHDPDRFCKELLPLYFKHGNNPTCSSFIRQLNMYGFRKVMNIGKITEANQLEFQHAFFLRGKAELLSNIKRRIPPSRDPRVQPQATFAEPKVNFSSNDVLTNLSILREKQKSMNETLTEIKKENEDLCRELSSVQQRHKNKEQVLHKVIQLLIQIIQRSNQHIHVPRKLTRMLQDSSISLENSQIARIVDVFRNSDSDCIFAPEENSPNPAGAVIHEITDFEPDVVNNSQSLSTTKFNTSILKPLQKSAESDTFSLNLLPTSVTPSSVEPLNIHENLPYRSVTTVTKEPSSATSNVGSPAKYIAVPVVGDPNKLCLIPAENFTSQQISNFKPDAFCNVIALPAKESVSENKETLSVKTIPSEFTKLSKNGISTKVMSSHLSNMETSSVNNLQELSSKNSPEYSDLSPDIDDCVLSNLLQASKISTLEDVRDSSSVNDTSMDFNSFGEPQSSESSNYQLAIPEPSSLVKSKNYPYNSFLPDAMYSPSGLLEQLFCSDDGYNNASVPNPLSNEKDFAMTSSSNDISGNELVQYNPTSNDVDDVLDIDQLQLLDFLEPYYADSQISKFCGPQDFDVLLPSNTSNQSNLEVLKNETMLTTPLYSPGRITNSPPFSCKPKNSETESKRRKIE